MDELKLVMMGGGGVGKSALTIQFTSGYFVDEYDPTIEDSYRKQVFLDGTSYICDILDTAGQEEFSSMQDQWIRDAQGFLLVYSIDSRSSFSEIEHLYAKILRVKDADTFPCMIIGNKSDLEARREVLEAEGRDAARSCRSPFMECSAKLNSNVELAFLNLARLVVKHNRTGTDVDTEAAGCLCCRPQRQGLLTTPMQKKTQEEDEEEGDVVASGNRNYHTGSVWCQLIVENTLFTGSRDCTARAWNIRTGEHLMCYRGHTSRVYALAVAKELLASGSGDSTIRVWNIKSGVCVSILKGHEEKRGICALVFQDNTIFSASTDQTVRVWEWPSGACVAVLPCESKLNALVVYHNTVFAGCLESHDVKVFQLRFQQQFNSLSFVPKKVGTLTGHSNYVMHMVVRAGRSGLPSLLFTASSDKTIRAWDASTLSLSMTFIGHKDGVNAIAATDSLLFSASRDHTAKSWSIATGECLQDFIGHTNSVRAIAVAPQGNNTFRVATGGKDMGVRVWHSATGECLWLFEGCEDWINCLSIAGTVVFAGCRDSTVRSWDLNSGTLQRIFFDRKRARWGELQPRLRIFQGIVLLVIEFLQLVSFALSEGVQWVGQPFLRLAPVMQLDLRRFGLEVGVGPMVVGSLLLVVCYLSAYKIYAWRTLWRGGLQAWRLWCLICQLCSTVFFIPICKSLVLATLCASNPSCYRTGTGELGVILLCLFLPPAFRLAAVDGRLDKMAFYFWNPFVTRYDHADLRRIHLFSRANSTFDRLQLCLALLMIVFSVVFSELVKDAVVLQIAMLACSVLMCLNALKFPPYHHATVNGARFGSFSAVVVMNLLGLGNALSPDKTWTILSFCLTPLTFISAFAFILQRSKDLH